VHVCRGFRRMSNASVILLLLRCC